VRGIFLVTSSLQGRPATSSLQGTSGDLFAAGASGDLFAAKCPAARQAPKELPQPQVCFAFGLWKTKPCVSSAVS